MKNYTNFATMVEKQNIEYKQSWHDDYLKWVCGFANAIGGIIYIGIDDRGNITHLSDYEKLMEDIPNKIRIPAYIVLITGFVSMIDMFLAAYLPDLYKSLGLFIPLRL